MKKRNAVDEAALAAPEQLAEDSAVSCVAVARRFGDRYVLNGVDLRVPYGSVTALLGRNSAGKSTLLRALVGLVRPDHGTIRVLDLNPALRGAAVRRRVGFAPERFELPRWMRVRDYLAFLEPFYPTWSAADASRLLDQLGVDPGEPTEILSKGSRAKLSLVAALAHAPALLLLDEPFSGLDPIVRDEILATVLRSLREEQRTVLLASHSIADVERVADRVAILDGGRVALEGDLEEIARWSVRLAVTLRDGAGDWKPPGAPSIERNGNVLRLTYLGAAEDEQADLGKDPNVASFEPLPRDLTHIFAAAVGGTLPVPVQEPAPCTA